jgi:glycosyltransferase involved in cell wall biosynthesis
MPLRFYIVGGPIYRTSGSQWSLTELQLQARSLGLGDKVGFVSFQPDTLEIYRALDVVVHASTRPEPFGRTIVEAMACARPVVISRAGGAAELFEDEFDAIGVPLGDSEALAMAIARLATDTELRRRLGTSARLTAVQAFDRERLGHCVCQLYDRLLHRKAA